jgi:hypothetical protein
MNLQELINWRKDCFFCGDELAIYPEVNGLQGEFSLKDNIFTVYSTYFSFSFYTDSGILNIPDKIGLDLHNFLNRQSINIKLQCQECTAATNGQMYNYEGNFRATRDLKVINMTSLSERVYVVDKFTLHQFVDHSVPELRTALITPWNKRRLLFDSMGQGVAPSMITQIKTPYINLFKNNPESLENKIRTYILFS